MNLSNTLILALVISAFSLQLHAQTKLSVQGVIRLSDGNAIEDGLYPIEFKLYDTIIGGNVLWSEVQPQLKVTSGIYSTILGGVTPLNLEFDEFYYLSLTVDGEELLPRAPLTSAPYSNSVLGFENVFPSTGNVGVGTLSPMEKMSVVGDVSMRQSGNSRGKLIFGDPSVNLNYAGIEGFSPTPNDFRLRFFAMNSGNTNPQLRMTLTEGGSLGIGTDAPTHQLHITGVGRSTSASWATSSDARVKENVQTLTGGILDKIMKLRPVTYEWKQNYKKENPNLKTKNTGFLSQEVEKIFSDMVTQEEERFGDTVIEDFRVLNLSELPVYLVKAIQEQQGQIESLKKENDSLKKLLTVKAEASNNRLAQLEAKVEELLNTKSVSKL